MRKLRIIAYVLMIVLLCLLAVILVTGSAGAKTAAGYTEKAESGVTALDLLTPLVLAGAERRSAADRGGGGKQRAAPKRAAKEKRVAASENLVVDTLNLTHWLNRRTPRKKIGTCDILAAIAETAPALRKKYPGRVVYVLKDRDSAEGGDPRLRELYAAAARDNRVYIDVVEKLAGDRPGGAHAALGRDDFYTLMLAWKYGCPVLSRDRYRDVAEMKSGQLQSFHVYLFSPYRDHPERDFVNPAAPEFRKMGRPVLVDYEDVLPKFE